MAQRNPPRPYQTGTAALTIVAILLLFMWWFHAETTAVEAAAPVAATRSARLRVGE